MKVKNNTSELVNQVINGDLTVTGNIINQKLSELTVELEKLIVSLAQDTDWHEVGAAGEPAFQNSWVNYNSGTHETAAFRKDGFGYVHFKGGIKSGADAVFTLPVGYRPSLILNAMGMSSDGANNYIAVVNINNNGTVTVYPGTNVYVSISGITFYAG